MERWIRVSKADKENLPIPIKPATFYKWHHLKRHSEIFRKLGGFLFVDLKALEKLME